MRERENVYSLYTVSLDILCMHISVSYTPSLPSYISYPTNMYNVNVPGLAATPPLLPLAAPPFCCWPASFEIRARSCARSLLSSIPISARSLSLIVRNNCRSTSWFLKTRKWWPSEASSRARFKSAAVTNYSIKNITILLKIWPF